MGISNRHLALALAEGEGDTQYDWSAVLAEGFELLDFSDVSKSSQGSADPPFSFSLSHHSASAMP